MKQLFTCILFVLSAACYAQTSIGCTNCPTSGTVFYRLPATITAGDSSTYHLSSILPSVTITNIDLLWVNQAFYNKTVDYSFNTGTKILVLNFSPNVGDKITFLYH